MSKEPCEYGSFSSFYKPGGPRSPREIYRVRLEYLKEKQKEKQKCVVCGEKASYVEGYLFFKKYYCDEHKEEKINGF